MRWRILLAVAALLVTAFAVCLASAPLRWRAQLIGKKAVGALPELSWGELLSMVSSRGGYHLEVVITEDRSVQAALDNPFQSPQDRLAGAALFRARCAVCHGTDATGDRGPALNAPGYKHGDSDWAIYRVIHDGVPGTAMAPNPGKGPEVWQIITFLRERQNALAAFGAQAGGEASVPHTTVKVRFRDIAEAAGNPRDWPTYSRTLDGWRYSPLTDVSSDNVSQLRVRWIAQLETDERIDEASPIAVGGLLYLSEPPGAVTALDAHTGRSLWRFKHDVPAGVRLCCGNVNRGIAVVNDMVLLGTLDSMLVAIDANDGQPRWTAKVASPSDGYSITGAPLVVGDSVVVGVSGGEYGTRGFVAAYDVSSGREKWRFWTVPAPGEPGHETWHGDSWKSGGGPAWVTGSYDASTNLLYWGVGNPSPNYMSELRLGDNLYTSSVVALHAGTGKLAWHFQFTPHDERDWDANQTPILADLVVGGARRSVLCTANRNGFYYVLDRATGEFLVGVPFVKQTWASRLDDRGRPIETGVSRPSLTGTLVSPGVGGGTNWQPPAFHPGLARVFVPATEGSSVFSKSMPEHVHRSPGQFYTGSGSSIQHTEPVIRALDAATGRREWEYRIARTPSVLGQSGLLATAGNLVFGASEGTLAAVDATTGQGLWSIFLGGPTFSPPISFVVDDRQAIAVVAGRSVFLFDLPPQPGKPSQAQLDAGSASEAAGADDGGDAKPRSTTGNTRPAWTERGSIRRRPPPPP
jgi:alcohol dehydrogenase (cytochrome c)